MVEGVVGTVIDEEVAVIKARVGAEVEVPNEKIDEREKGDTDTEEGMMIGNEKNIVIGPAVDQCPEVAHLRQQHPWHRVLHLETVLLSEGIVEIDTGTNEHTKVKAVGRNGRSRPEDIVQGGSDLNLSRRPALPLLGRMVSKGDLNLHNLISRCRRTQKKDGLCREKTWTVWSHNQMIVER